MITVNMELPAAGVQQEVAARGGVATVEPPPDEADVPNVQNGEPTSVEAFLDTGAGTNEEASAGFPAPADLETSLPETVERPSQHPLPPPSSAVRSRSRPASGRGRKSSRSTSRPLQSVFNELRQQARQSGDETAAHEHRDRALYHLRDGDEAAAMVELRTAVQALAAFTELNARRRGYRDVTARIAALSAASSTNEAS